MAMSAAREPRSLTAPTRPSCPGRKLPTGCVRACWSACADVSLHACLEPRLAFRLSFASVPCVCRRVRKLARVRVRVHTRMHTCKPRRIQNARACSTIGALPSRNSIRIARCGSESRRATHKAVGAPVVSPGACWLWAERRSARGSWLPVLMKRLGLYGKRPRRLVLNVCAKCDNRFTSPPPCAHRLARLGPLCTCVLISLLLPFFPHLALLPAKPAFPCLFNRVHPVRAQGSAAAREHARKQRELVQQRSSRVGCRSGVVGV